jgi:hypothetical protein
MASPTAAGRLWMETAVPGGENNCLAQKSTMPDGRNFVRWIGVGDINAIQIIL